MKGNFLLKAPPFQLLKVFLLYKIKLIKRKIPVKILDYTLVGSSPFLGLF